MTVKRAAQIVLKLQYLPFQTSEGQTDPPHTTAASTINNERLRGNQVPNTHTTRDIGIGVLSSVGAPLGLVSVPSRSKATIFSDGSGCGKTEHRHRTLMTWRETPNDE